MNATEFLKANCELDLCVGYSPKRGFIAFIVHEAADDVLGYGVAEQMDSAISAAVRNAGRLAREVQS